MTNRATLLLLGACCLALTVSCKQDTETMETQSPAAEAVNTQALAEEAYIYALPLIMSYKTMYSYAVDANDPNFKAPFNQIKNTARVYGPKDTAVVSANSDTPYSLLWMDLRTEPVVLTVPIIDEKRYYSVMLQDLSTYLIPYIGSRTTGNKGGSYMITGPGWKGEKPEGIDQVMNSQTDFLFAVYRTQLFNAQDLDNVKKVQVGYKVQSLSEFLGTEAPDGAAALDFPAWDEEAATGNNFIAYLNFLLGHVTPDATEKALWEKLAPIGVAPGKAFEFDKLSADQQQAITAGIKSAEEKIKTRTSTLKLAGHTQADYDHDWLKRAAVTQLGWGANDPKEASYPHFQEDGDGNPLDASKGNYTLTFAKGQQPPVKAFWSLTMYDGKTQLMIENPLNRYLLNSTMLSDMKLGDDGSLTLYIQKDSPGEELEANWLPAPDGPFYMLLRLYWPDKAFLDGTWKVPAVEKVNSSEPTPMKMTTEIPESITIADKVETSIGTLTFEDGFPTEDTAQKIYDQLDFQRAVESVMMTTPGASVHAFALANREYGPDNEAALLWPRMDSKVQLLTPNTTVIYVFMWMDLKDSPMVMEVPPKVMGIVDDHWFKYVADFGMAGPDKGKGGKYLFLPPGYEGETPEGYYVAQSATYGNWVVFRGFLENGDPAPGVKSIKENFKLYPLGKTASASKVKYHDMSMKYLNTIHASDETFFDHINDIVQHEPNTAQNAEILGLLRSIGIEKGKPFNPDARMKKILKDAAKVGSAASRVVLYRSRDPEAPIWPGSGWEAPWIGNSSTFEKDGVSLIDARTRFHMYATGITPAMVTPKVGSGTQYIAGMRDSDGNPLDGSKTYKVHLPPNVPARQFWAFTLYNVQTRSMLQTDQRFPEISSNDKGLKQNADGSFDVYFGPTPPAGEKSNWVQTVPGMGWHMLFRLYGPEQAWFDKTWRPSEVELMDGEVIPVTSDNYAQAEAAENFATWAKLGSDKKLFHYRDLAPVGSIAPTVRMNWDTLYSCRIVKVSDDHTFEVTLPETDMYVSAQVIDENGFSPYFVVEKGVKQTLKVDTDYAWVLFRTEIVDRKSKEGLKKVHAVQDGIKISGMMEDSTYVMANYDQKSLMKLRADYTKEFLAGGAVFTYARKAGEVDQHVLNLSHAAGWGGYPPELHKSNAYSSSKNIPGDKAYALTFEDPKNKFFTSFTLYDTDSYLMAGETQIKSSTWKPNPDGTITLHFNAGKDAINNLSSGGKTFNYVVRNYGVSQKVLDGKFKPVDPKPVK